jgi:uncharacterized membrane protein YciS (DUF1049 family)
MMLVDVFSSVFLIGGIAYFAITVITIPLLALINKYYTAPNLAANAPLEIRNPIANLFKIGLAILVILLAGIFLLTILIYSSY